MRLYQIPSLRIEDFPSENRWIGRLFIQMNPFLTVLSQIINGGIDFGTNIQSVSRFYTQTFNSTEAFEPFGLLWTFTGSSPSDVRVISATKGAVFTPTIILVAWQYDAATSGITISQMLEVTSSGIAQLSGDYQFTIRATV